MSYLDPRWYDSAEKLRGDEQALLALVLLQATVTCSTTRPVPEPQGGSDWRRCAQECPGVFTLDPEADPPCRCLEVP